MDDDPAPGRWILTSSQDIVVRESILQWLARRAQLHELLPLTWGEIRRVGRAPASLDEVLFTGGYPKIFDDALADDAFDPTGWCRAYIGRYLDRDVRTVVNVGDLSTFHRFLGLCARRTGQLLNYSSLAHGCGISQPTAKRWVDILETSFLVFRLPAFQGGIRQRAVKTPKLYFRDTGVACWLMGIHDLRQLRAHPKRGAIFETWVVSEALKNRAHRGLGRRGLAFYRDQNGVEATLVINHAEGGTLLDARSRPAPSSDMFRNLRRVRTRLPRPHASDPVVVYGGDERELWAGGELLPWRMVRSVALRDGAGVVQVRSGGRPVASARILVASPVHPNMRWTSARTDATGEAVLDLNAPFLPPTLTLTLFIAAPGFEPWLERQWCPAEGAITIDLVPFEDGGGVIFPQGSGYISGLAGRVAITDGGTGRGIARIRAQNIAINGEAGGEISRGVSGDRRRPTYFKPGETLHLEDADGGARRIRVLHVVGRSALVEYRPAG